MECPYIEIFYLIITDPFISWEGWVTSTNILGRLGYIHPHPGKVGLHPFTSWECWVTSIHILGRLGYIHSHPGKVGLHPLTSWEGQVTSIHILGRLGYIRTSIHILGTIEYVGTSQMYEDKTDEEGDQLSCTQRCFYVILIMEELLMMRLLFWVEYRCCYVLVY